MNEKMSNIDDQIKQYLKEILEVIDAHECACFSCNRDGNTYCDCLENAAQRAKKILILAEKSERE